MLPDRLVLARYLVDTTHMSEEICRLFKPVQTLKGILGDVLNACNELSVLLNFRSNSPRNSCARD